VDTNILRNKILNTRFFLHLSTYIEIDLNSAIYHKF